MNISKQIIKDYLQSNLTLIELENYEKCCINFMKECQLRDMKVYEVWISFSNELKEINEYVVAENETQAEELVLDELDARVKDFILTYGANRVK